MFWAYSTTASVECCMIYSSIVPSSRSSCRTLLTTSIRESFPFATQIAYSSVVVEPSGYKSSVECNPLLFCTIISAGSWSMTTAEIFPAFSASAARFALGYVMTSAPESCRTPVTGLPSSSSYPLISSETVKSVSYTHLREAAMGNIGQWRKL